MNRKFAVLLLAAALALAAFPAGARAEDPAGTVYLGLGDSYAYGWGAANPQKGGYVPRFYHFLQGDPFGHTRELVNLGYGGETSESFITGVLPGHPTRNPSQLGQALATINGSSDISVVTLDIGGNDLLDLLRPGEVCAEYPPTQACMQAAQQAIYLFGVNYANTIMPALAGELAADPGTEEFIVMTYPNPWSGTDSAYEGVVDILLLGNDGEIDCANQAGWGMNDITACVGQAYGATVVDIYPSFLGRALELTHIAEGDIHPNDRGYEVIASVFKTVYR